MKKIPEITFNPKVVLPSSIEVVSFSLLGERLKNTTDHTPFQPHQLKFNLILLITNGPSGVHDIDFEEYTYSQSSIVLIAKEQIHAFRDLPYNNKGWSIIFTEDFFLEVCASFPFLSNHLYLSLIHI